MERQARKSVGVENRLQLVDHWCVQLGFDDTYAGLNIYTMTDLNLLIKWWNLTVRYMNNLVEGKTSKQTEMSYLQAALWIRINELHPKVLLRFEDITHKTLLCKR